MPQIIVGIVILVILYFLIIYIIIPFVIVAIGIGVLIGSGHAIYNYGVSLKNNIKP